MKLKIIGNPKMGIDLEGLEDYQKKLGMWEHDVDIYFSDEENAEELFYKFWTDGLVFPGIDGMRGFCCWHIRDDNMAKADIGIFCTRYETEASIQWILYHELTHFGVGNTNLLNNFFHWKERKISSQLGYRYQELQNPELRVTDEIHEQLPEEVFCNEVATMTMSGHCYDRKWWRANIEKVNSESKEV